MADEKTRADSLRLYHSGAGSVDAAQADQAASLGGNRSSTEIEVLGHEITSPISNITIDFVSGQNGTGDGTLTATGDDTLTWTPPGDTVGSAVTIANGETKIIEGDDASKFVRVSRTSTDALSGAATLTLTDVFNNAIGFDNISSDDATAGVTQYRAIFVKNEHPTVAVQNSKLYLKTLGTQRVSDSTQLSASGAGTIVTTGSFADWPDTGWCHIKTSGGSTREIVYYSSRTATTLTVPTGGRGRLGTSAAAGASTDTLDAVPGVRIAKEEPSSNAIQTIADEETAPTGLTWGTPITEADAISIGTLDVGDDYGIWIEYQIPAGAEAAASVLNSLALTFDAA